jgi:translation initiation factor eIF-2B subunit alpha
MVAKAMRRPFYVAVESYKFARMYPLTQRDIVDLVDNPSKTGPSVNPLKANSGHEDDMADLAADFGTGVNYTDLTIDFTPAEYITLLFTDLGVLTPAAVSDELIRMYQ